MIRFKKNNREIHYDEDRIYANLITKINKPQREKHQESHRAEILAE